MKAHFREHDFSSKGWITYTLIYSCLRAQNGCVNQSYVGLLSCLLADSCINCRYWKTEGQVFSKSSLFIKYFLIVHYSYCTYSVHMWLVIRSCKIAYVRPMVPSRETLSVLPSLSQYNSTNHQTVSEDDDATRDFPVPSSQLCMSIRVPLLHRYMVSTRKAHDG